MTTCLPLLARAADDAWHSALKHQLRVYLPTCRLHIARQPDVTQPLAVEGISENLQDLGARAVETPDQAQIMDTGENLLLALYLSDPLCAILLEYPLDKPSDQLVHHLQALLDAVVTQAVDYVRLTLRHQTDSIRQRQLQRELEALQGQLQASTHETTDLLAQLRQQDSDYVATLEREVARQTTQLQEANTRLEVANAAKNQFLALMSHELRTPLNGILGMSELLLNGPHAEEQREFIEAIRDADQALFVHVQHLLDFSQIEARQLTINCIDFNLRYTIEEVLDTFAAVAHSKGLDFSKIVHAHVPEWVCGDSERLCQVLSCLLDNAIEFTEDGEIIAKVTCVEHTPQEVCLHIEVTDTGIGIAPEDQEHLFEPFTQIDNSNTRHHGGMGLGLAVTSQLVTQMGGTVGMSSKPGQGSTFWMILRLKKPSVTPDIPHQLSSPSARVLIADAHGAHRAPIVKHLQKLGLQVEEATSGPGALELIWQAQTDGQPYQCIVVDDCLPGLHGMALARIMQEETYYVASRVILMGAAREQEQCRETQQVELAAYLSKPVDPANLAQRIADLSAGAASPCAHPTRHDTPNETFVQRPSLLLVSTMESCEQRFNLRQLTQCGYRVDVIEPACDDVGSTTSIAYDGIIIDCTALDVSTRIIPATIRKYERYSGRHIPTIALTTEPHLSVLDACPDSDVEACVRQPIVFGELQSALSTWVPFCSSP